ncbi:hypothetical protein R1flu_025514 [Riccia fluitans]|uniref:Uncharacterized protein n=1 Tax=Riccia fluitans TaxID=41844 RepID=A0ABD1XXY8_9MARC
MARLLAILAALGRSDGCWTLYEGGAGSLWYPLSRAKRIVCVPRRSVSLLAGPPYSRKSRAGSSLGAFKGGLGAFVGTAVASMIWVWAGRVQLGLLRRSEVAIRLVFLRVMIPRPSFTYHREILDKSRPASIWQVH